jgi:hypothetical protein
MKSRTDLSPIFKDILSKKYDKFKVYFQPPAGQKIEYPCIVYQLASLSTNYANDAIYRKDNHYTVTIIGTDPDNDILIDEMLKLKYCSFDRRFISDNMYHDVFDLYY